ncbi:MAG TPA: hypothetical protein VGJ44_01905, partial [Kribbellaceae bacterium]
RGLVSRANLSGNPDRAPPRAAHTFPGVPQPRVIEPAPKARCTSRTTTLGGRGGGAGGGGAMQMRLPMVGTLGSVAMMTMVRVLR